MATFSVFPPRAPAVPKIALPNPHNRKPSLSKDLISSMVTETVLLRVEEHPVPKIPIEHLPKSTPRQSPTPDGAKTLVNGSPDQRLKVIDREQRSNSRGTTNISNHSSPEPGSIDTSSTLAGEASTAGGPKSPVVPIRSMFPIYNPNIPLADQHYYPQRPAQAYGPSIPVSKYCSRQDLRSQIASPIDRDLGAKTAPQSVADIPMEAMNSREARFSSNKTLERLWDATHGTEPNQTAGSFDLEMARTSDATFTFGARPDLPFYSITTYDTNEISISKTCPRKRTLTCDVALTSLEPVERRLPPNDGLVTFIFPKMAAMLAINQSAALADDHSLAPTHRDEVQAAAMRRAAEQEASHLRYNHIDRRYELDHPAISRRSRDPSFITSPTTPLSEEKQSLHINVHSTVGRTTHGKPSIAVTFPSNRGLEAIDPGSRFSTMGQSETDASLATLDFHSNTLHIDANRILELMPSLFAIDSIVSAILAVAIADYNTNVVMGNMEIWLPAPRRGLGSPGSAMSWGGASTFYATVAERDDAEAEARAMEAAHKKDLKSNQKSRAKVERGNRTWYGKQKVPKTKKQIVVAEFDLEKLGQFQSGTRKGQELPRPVRMIVSMLVGGLKFIVWILTSIVQLLVWILVRATRCVTSEKF